MKLKKLYSNCEVLITIKNQNIILPYSELIQIVQTANAELKNNKIYGDGYILDVRIQKCKPK